MHATGSWEVSQQRLWDGLPGNIDANEQGPEARQRASPATSQRKAILRYVSPELKMNGYQPKGEMHSEPRPAGWRSLAGYKAEAGVSRG
jgi:hypothetical protein